MHTPNERGVVHLANISPTHQPSVRLANMDLHAITKYLLRTARHAKVKSVSFIIMNWQTVDVGSVGCLAVAATAATVVVDVAEKR